MTEKEIKKKIDHAKAYVLYWKGSFKNEALLYMKMYLSGDEEEAAIAEKRGAYAWSELKKYEEEVKRFEHELSERIGS